MDRWVIDTSTVPIVLLSLFYIKQNTKYFHGQLLSFPVLDPDRVNGSQKGFAIKTNTYNKKIGKYRAF